MAGRRIVLLPLEHRQRLLLKRRLQLEREEPTPASGCVRLFGVEDFLPWDPTSPDQFFLGIHHDVPERPLLGSLWVVIDPRRRTARLYDIHLDDGARVDGTSEAALVALEDWLGQHNCRELRLEIHERAPLTIALLEKLGYGPVAIHLAKPLRRRPQVGPAG